MNAIARGPLRPWLGAIAASVGLFALAAVLAPLAPIDPEASPRAAIAAYLLAFAAVSAMAIAAGATVPAFSGRAAFAVAAVAAAIGGLASVALPRGHAAAAALVLASLLVGGSLAGALVGARVQHPGHLSVVALVSSIADAWSVLSAGGPSAAIAEHPPLLDVLALSFPMLGTRAIEPLLGVGDVVFVALYLAAARRHGLGLRRSVVALGLALGSVATAVVALARAVPALPMLGAAMLAAHPAARLPPPHERRRAALALGVLAVLVALVLSLRA